MKSKLTLPVHVLLIFGTPGSSKAFFLVSCCFWNVDWKIRLDKYLKNSQIWKMFTLPLMRGGFSKCLCLSIGKCGKCIWKVFFPPESPLWKILEDEMAFKVSISDIDNSNCVCWTWTSNVQLKIWTFSELHLN